MKSLSLVADAGAICKDQSSFCRIYDIRKQTVTVSRTSISYIAGQPAERSESIHTDANVEFYRVLLHVTTSPQTLMFVFLCPKLGFPMLYLSCAFLVISASIALIGIPAF